MSDTPHGLSVIGGTPIFLGVALILPSLTFGAWLLVVALGLVIGGVAYDGWRLSRGRASHTEERAK